MKTTMEGGKSYAKGKGSNKSKKERKVILDQVTFASKAYPV